VSAISTAAAGPRRAPISPRSLRAGCERIPYRGILPATVTTPGSVASWGEAHAAYGRLPLARSLESAIGYAREGYPVTARLAAWIAACANDLAPHAASAELFLPGGDAPRPGALLRNRGLARTLEAVASEGAAGFYAGEVGASAGRFVATEGGFFTENDLKAQDARWSEPLVGSYRGVTLYETPAPTQGFTVLEMLNLLQPFELHQQPSLRPTLCTS
jgi:gamma-glutamyltranspeptidase/glutathione hydrolase